MVQICTLWLIVLLGSDGRNAHCTFFDVRNNVHDCTSFGCTQKPSWLLGSILSSLFLDTFRFWISIGGLLMNVKPKSLPFSIDNCSNETLSKVTDMNGVYERLNATNHYELEDM